MALTKLSTDVIDLSGNTEGLVIPSGTTTSTTDTTGTCDFPASAGAVALYQFADNANDTCGNFNPFTQGGITYAAGKFGKAAVFNPSTPSYIRLADNSIQYTNTSFSVWVYPTVSQAGEVGTIFSNWGYINGNQEKGFLIRAFNTSLNIRINQYTSGGTQTYNSTGTLNLNAWNHVAITMSQTQTKIYLDNAAPETFTTSGYTFNTSYPHYPGIGVYQSPQYFAQASWQGMLDQMRIYDAILTAGDVTKLYNETNVTTTSGRPTSPTEGLLRDNTTTGALEFYDGSLWQQISGTLVPGFIASENFNTRLYTGTGANTVVTGVGFAPEFIWIKNTGAITEHIASDIVRGTLNEVSPNNTYKAELRGIAGFDSDGFTLDSVSTANYSSGNLVSWNWKAGGSAISNYQGSITTQVSVNQDAGFSIVKYTGTGNSTSTIGHGITAGAPDIIICKDTTNEGTSWPVYSSALPAVTNNLFLNLDTTTSQYQNRFSAVTSTTFSSGTSGGEVNGNGATMIAYCWKSIPSYSKIGSYVGTGSTGNAQDIGFEPAFLMCKRYSSNSGWYIIDNKRSTSNPRNKFLEANEIGAQYTPGDGVNFTPTGFSFINTDLNGGGQNWLYMAFSK